MKSTSLKLLTLSLKIAIFLGLFLFFTKWAYTCKGTSPLTWMPTETVLKMHEFFGIGCCEEVADFELTLAALISLPLASLAFWTGGKIWEVILRKIRK